MMELYLVVIQLRGAWLDRLILIALPVLDGVRVVEVQEVEGGIVALARHVNVQRLQEAAELLPIEGAAVVRVELYKRRLIFFTVAIRIHVCRTFRRVSAKLNDGDPLYAQQTNLAKGLANVRALHTELLHERRLQSVHARDDLTAENQALLATVL